MELLLRPQAQRRNTKTFQMIQPHNAVLRFELCDAA